MIQGLESCFIQSSSPRLHLDDALSLSERETLQKVYLCTSGRPVHRLLLDVELLILCFLYLTNNNFDFILK